MSRYKTTIVSLIEDENAQPGTAIEVSHHTPQRDEDVVQAIRLAVEQFALTPNGQSAWIASDKDFNWGDLLYHLDDVKPFLPEWIYGLRRVALGTDVRIVNHDERLMRALEGR
jgi:hypothetical protein